MDETWLLAIAQSPWLYPVLLALVIGDAFLVVLPSETAVVALGALWGSTGSPPIAAVLPIAAVGAIVGDSLCYLLGRRIGLDRWHWQRVGRVRAGIERVRATILRRPAVLILTARYIPFARIAVNLTAGASGLRYGRFLPLSALAGAAWAVYNVVIGASFGAIWADQPLLAIVVSVVVAITVGIMIDTIATRIARRREARETDR